MNSIKGNTPAYQMDGIKLLDALADIGVIERSPQCPEPEQTQFDMKFDCDCGTITQKQLTYFQEKFKPDYLEVRSYFDSEEDENVTVVELIYGKNPNEEDDD